MRKNTLIALGLILGYAVIKGKIEKAAAKKKERVREAKEKAKFDFIETYFVDETL